MRLILATLFVIIAVPVVLVLVHTYLPQLERAPFVLLLSAGLMLVLLCLAADYLFNRPEHRFAEFKSAESIMRELEARNLLVSSTFRAKRAFRVEDYDDEGPHYFIELEDGSVLYLGGQYLYDYEPIKDDSELNQPRRFPCTDFTVRRRRDEGHVVEIICNGAVFEPEVTISASDWWVRRRASRDGLVLTDVTYGQVKAERMGTS